MVRVPGREPYRVRLHPYGLPGTPGGPAGAVRRGTKLRSSSSSQEFPCPAAGSPQGRGMAGAGHAEPLGWAAPRPAHRDASGRPRAASSFAATVYQRRHARAVQGRNDRRVGRRYGATCLPPRTATRCRQVTRGAGISRAPRTRARRRCPGPPAPAGPRRSARPGWPGSPTRRIGRRRSRARSAR
jgi:hypothetical protein